jgi:O-antigen/teichoic acid export membrane protein
LSQPSDESGHLPAAQTDRPVRAERVLSRYYLLFGADAASRGLRFLADLVLARHFGQTVFGQLNLAQSLAVQGIGIANCGLDTAAMRDVAVTPASTQTLAATVVLLRLVLGFLTWSCLAGLSWLVPQFRDSLTLTALYSLSLFTGALTLGWVAQGRGQVHVVALAILVSHVSYFGGVQLAVRFGWPPAAVPAVLIVAETLTAGSVWIWVIRTIGPVSRSLPIFAMLHFLRDSMPIGGANLLRGFTVGSDVLLLGLFVDTADVGLYAGAFKLYSLGLSVAALYLTVLLPHLARRAAGSRPAVNAALHVALGRSLMAAVPVTFASLFLAQTALRLLFPPGFQSATGALQILLLALPLTLIAGHYRTALVAEGLQRHDLGLVTIGAIVHLGAKLVLIPILGSSGAAWGTLTGEAILMLASAYVWRTVSRVRE